MCGRGAPHPPALPPLQCHAKRDSRSGDFDAVRERRAAITCRITRHSSTSLSQSRMNPLNRVFFPRCRRNALAEPRGAMLLLEASIWLPIAFMAGSVAGSASLDALHVALIAAALFVLLAAGEVRQRRRQAAFESGRVLGLDVAEQLLRPGGISARTRALLQDIDARTWLDTTLKKAWRRYQRNMSAWLQSWLEINVSDSIVATLPGFVKSVAWSRVELGDAPPTILRCVPVRVHNPNARHPPHPGARERQAIGERRRRRCRVGARPRAQGRVPLLPPDRRRPRAPHRAGHPRDGTLSPLPPLRLSASPLLSPLPSLSAGADPAQGAAALRHAPRRGGPRAAAAEGGASVTRPLTRPPTRGRWTWWSGGRGRGPSRSPSRRSPRSTSPSPWSEPSIWRRRRCSATPSARRCTTASRSR